MIEVLSTRGKHVDGLTHGQTIIIVQEGGEKIRAKVRLNEHLCTGVTENKVFHLSYDEVKHYFICNKVSTL
jgi:hypothetical protein